MPAGRTGRHLILRKSRCIFPFKVKLSRVCAIAGTPSVNRAHRNGSFALYSGAESAARCPVNQCLTPE